MEVQDCAVGTKKDSILGCLGTVVMVAMKPVKVTYGEYPQLVRHGKFPQRQNRTSSTKVVGGYTGYILPTMPVGNGEEAEG